MIQEDEYYSFGLRKPTGGFDYSNNNRYLYNGKEIQTDLANQYDYGARFYDPAIGRWTTVDPASEEGGQESLTQYQYGMNNPVRYDDPDGRCPTCPPSDWELTAVENGEMGRGLVESVTETVSGLWNAVTNPIETLSSLGNAIAHPIATGEAVINDFKAEFSASPQRAMGKGFG